MYYYFTSAQAENIKSTYASWIGRAAYLGKGKVSVLSEIIIKPKKNFRPFSNPTQQYSIYFQFVEGRRLRAEEFFLLNGLMTSRLYSNR